jgi:hypothetical protein
MNAPTFLVLAVSKPRPQFDALVQLAQGLKPSAAIVPKAVHVIRTAADDFRSKGTIGKHCTFVIVPSDLDMTASGGYDSPGVAFKAFAPAYIKAIGDGSAVYAIRGIETRGENEQNEAQPVAIPRVKGHLPCPCGSGKKYKKCCGAEA